MNPTRRAANSGRRARVRVALLLGLASGGFAALEGGLRLVGFGESYLEFDRVTRWVLRPGYRGPGPDLPHVELAYDVRVNAHGFRGGPIEPEKREGRLRYLALGDSVTFGFGVREDETYPSVVARALEVEAGSAPVEVVNAGVPGFTTLQGLRHFEARGLPLRPDLVTIFFGWNDGWRTDVPDAAWIGRLGGTRALLESSRAASFVRRGFGFLRRRIAGSGTPPPRPTLPRVPLDEFEENLVRIVQAVRRAGGLPVLVTAPAAFGPDRPPEAYFRESWTVPREELEPLRLRYATGARRATETTGAPIADCAKALPSDPQLFFEDGYHPRPQGHRAIAEEIVRVLKEVGALERGSIPR